MPKLTCIECDSYIPEKDKESHEATFKHRVFESEF